MKIRTLAMMLTLLVAVLAIGCSSAPTPTPTPMFYPGELTELIRRDLSETFFNPRENLVTRLAAGLLLSEASEKPGVSVEDLPPYWEANASSLKRISCLKIYESFLLYEFEEAQVDDRIWSVAAVVKDTSETKTLAYKCLHISNNSPGWRALYGAGLPQP
jgi:hypothetical protein